MDNKSTVLVLFYIPDLTAFTKFMTSTGPEFANKVITLIMNKVSDANILAIKLPKLRSMRYFFTGKESCRPFIKLRNNLS